MIEVLIENHKNIINRYIYAKDKNRPHIMKETFTASASLEMVVKTENILFPSKAIGLDEITNILVRKFSQTYENVYTLCLSDSLENNKNEFSCNWLVCMTEKDGRSVRVGCGSYNWHFDNKKDMLADYLIITIEQMVVLTPVFSNQILDWVSKLPYPWCSSGTMIQSMPNLESLNPIREHNT